jgi:hypothetical protein
MVGNRDTKGKFQEVGVDPDLADLFPLRAAF